MRAREAIAVASAQDTQLEAELAEALAAGAITQVEHDQRLAEGLLPRCGPKTVNKHLDYIGACMKWSNKRFGWQLKNPFADNRYSKRELRKGGRPRRAMKSAELRALFETPLFTGCSTEDRRSLPGKLILKDAFYWVPLIVAFTGGRLEEICQLGAGDVIQLDDIWCIKISDEEDDQQVKTDSALRVIPLHPTLLKLGLVDRLLALRSKGERRLFPDLAAGGRYGRYGYRLSKRWTHYRRQVGLYAPGKDFHTLRHSFNTHLLNKNVPVVWMSQIMGHATSSQTAGYAVNFETSSTYYGGAEIPDLRDAVEQFDFGLRLVEVDGEWQIGR
jgi:integrase